MVAAPYVSVIVSFLSLALTNYYPIKNIAPIHPSEIQFRNLLKGHEIIAVPDEKISEAKLLFPLGQTHQDKKSMPTVPSDFHVTALDRHQPSIAAGIPTQMREEERDPFKNFIQETTPKAMVRFMWKNFAFETDRRQFGTEDYWQSPQELMRTQKGDCEDFAIFAYEFLRMNRVPSLLLSIYGKGYGHTVAVYREKGKYNIIDGTEMRTIETKSLQKMLTTIYPFWTRSAIVTPSARSPEGRILKIIERYNEEFTSTYLV